MDMDVSCYCTMNFAKVYEEDLQQHSSLKAALKVKILQQLCKQDGDADTATTSSESPTDTSGMEGDVSENDSLTESQSLRVKQRRNLLDNKLNNYKQEKLKRKLPKDGQLLEYAKDDIEMKKRLLNHIKKNGRTLTS